MGLRHSDRLGWIFVRHHLCAAKVVSSKNDPIDEILRLTGAWNFTDRTKTECFGMCKKFKMFRIFFLEYLPSSKLGNEADSCFFFLEKDSNVS